ncbi:MAG TPA: hypothetical protein VKR29_01010, partial [Candidatus Binataceae bacterium]|nr:hypothetical protein [Candidatus Binataceae bacterium]
MRRGFAVALIAIVGLTTIAASPTPSSSPSKAPSAVASVGLTASPAAREPDGPAVIGFLSQVIGWYRHLAVEQGLVSDPAEMLFVAEDRQMADEVLDLSFEFAKAQAARLAANDSEAPPEHGKHRVQANTESLT